MDLIKRQAIRGAADWFGRTLHRRSSQRAPLLGTCAFQSSTRDHGTNIIRFQTDVRVAARSFLARVLWLLGLPDQALRAAEKSVEDAKESDALALCYALALAACPIALWVQSGAAERYAELLLDHSREHSFPIWSRFGSNFKGVLAIKGGDLHAGLRLLRVGFDEPAIASPAFAS
jgi:hypothetical protein